MSVLSYVLLSSALALSPPGPSCSFDKAKFMAMPFASFDQDLAGGWRSLDQKLCSKEVADLLRSYRREHRPLSDRERAILSWHEGQAKALSGDYPSAIPLMMGGVQDDGGTINFVDYALGTVAFLQRDRLGLVAARSRLAAFPKPADHQDKVTVMQAGKPVTFEVKWPPNLDVLDGLIRCFDKPYKVAYSC